MAKSATVERPVPMRIAEPEAQKSRSNDSEGQKTRRPGDRCEQVRGKNQCKGFLSVTSTFVQGDGTRIRYLQCTTCHLPKPQFKQTIPSRYGQSKRKVPGIAY